MEVYRWPMIECQFRKVFFWFLVFFFYGKVNSDWLHEYGEKIMKKSINVKCSVWLICFKNVFFSTTPHQTTSYPIPFHKWTEQTEILISSAFIHFSVSPNSLFVLFHMQLNRVWMNFLSILKPIKSGKSCNSISFQSSIYIPKIHSMSFMLPCKLSSDLNVKYRSSNVFEIPKCNHNHNETINSEFSFTENYFYPPTNPSLYTTSTSICRIRNSNSNNNDRTQYICINEKLAFPLEEIKVKREKKEKIVCRFCGNGYLNGPPSHTSCCIFFSTRYFGTGNVKQFG